LKLSKEETEKWKKLYERFDLTKVKDEILENEEEMKRFAVVLAVLEFHATQGKMPTEAETEERAEELYIHLLFEKLKREGYVNVIYTEDKRRILKASLTEKGVEHALKIISKEGEK